MPDSPHLKKLTVNPIKLQTGLRPNSAGIPFTLLLRTEAIGFPTFGLLLYRFWGQGFRGLRLRVARGLGIRVYKFGV